MTAREIRRVFPDLEPGAIRAALLHAAELMRDEDSSLQSDDPVGATIGAAQASAGMSEADALTLAVSETRAVRRTRAARGK
jgi:hypothetical protein